MRWGGIAAVIAAVGIAVALPRINKRPEPLPVAPKSGPGSGVIPNDMLNAADPQVGFRNIQLCTACHSLLKDGEPGKVGPSLWGIVGAPVARRKDFAYSDALKALHEKGRVWTTDELYNWIHDPSGYAPGTKMMFAGMLDPQDRYDLIAYLMKLK